LLRDTLGEGVVFGEDERLWLRIKLGEFVLDDADLGLLLRTGDETALTGLDLFSESSGCTGTGIWLEDDITLLLFVESSAALEEPSTSIG